jgi:hemin uptake protein HemP
LPSDDHAQVTGRPRRSSEPSSAPTPEDCPVIAVDELLQKKREAVLVHNGVRYRLRVTSNDKLILTK